MDAQSNQLDLVEDFKGFHYISNGRLEDAGQRIEVAIEPIPIKQIAVFMSCFVLAVPLVLLFCAYDANTILGLSLAGAICGGMLVRLLWFVNQSSMGAKFPSIEKEHEELTLASGTKIGKDEIAYFRQLECKTNRSNFRLVVTTVVTSTQNQQFAVCAEIGRYKTTRIGSEIARHFGAEVKQSQGVVKTQALLEKLALE